MMYQPKRQSAAMMALLVFVFSVFPAKRSDAFAPPLIYAAYMTATVSGETYGLAALAGVIGLSGLYLTIKDAQDNAVRIPLGDKTDNQVPAPAADASAQAITQPASGRCGEILSALGSTSTPMGCTVTTSFQSNGQSSYSGGYYSCGYNRVVSSSTPGCESYNQTYSGESYSYFQPAPAVTCPAGYTISGSTCVLANARQATDDKACDLLYAQGAFATASDINCGSQADGTKLSPLIRDGKVLAYGTNSSGQPLMWEVAPGPQNWTVKVIEQVQTGTQTQVKTTTATIDSATSAVTSVQTETAPGTVSTPSGSTAPTTLAPGETASPVNTPTVTTDPSKPLAIQWPSDYARTGEAKTAADSITELMKPMSEVNDPTVPEWADQWGTTFNPLKAWNLPNHVSACPTSSFIWDGSLYSIDSHCQLITDHWSGLQTASVLFWTLAAMFIVLGA